MVTSGERTGKGVRQGRVLKEIQITVYKINKIEGYILQHVCVLVAQSCLTLCDPMDHSPPGSSVHGILQARILEWVTIPFSRASS